MIECENLLTIESINKTWSQFRLYLMESNNKLTKYLWINESSKIRISFKWNFLHHFDSFEWCKTKLSDLIWISFVTKLVPMCSTPRNSTWRALQNLVFFEEHQYTWGTGTDPLRSRLHTSTRWGLRRCRCFGRVFYTPVCIGVCPTPGTFLGTLQRTLKNNENMNYWTGPYLYIYI